MLVCMCVFMH